MLLRRLLPLWALIGIWAPSAHASLFGEETLAILKLVAGQAVELERLAEAVGIAKEQRDTLLKINEGIERTTAQIEAIDSVIQRAQGLDPSSGARISDITSMIQDVRDVQARAEEVITLKLLLTDQAIAQGALQSDTAYKMGQEMVGTGAELAVESKTASPGRAAQISASAESAQVLSDGVALQTLAQIAQLQAVSLELQKTQLERSMAEERARRDAFRSGLSGRTDGRGRR